MEQEVSVLLDREGREHDRLEKTRRVLEDLQVRLSGKLRVVAEREKAARDSIRALRVRLDNATQLAEMAGNDARKKEAELEEKKMLLLRMQIPLPQLEPPPTMEEVSRMEQTGDTLSSTPARSRAIKSRDEDDTPVTRKKKTKKKGR
ncbi:MAG: hypothetical protein SGPRY_012933 [Prymnesium sp.]